MHLAGSLRLNRIKSFGSCDWNLRKLFHDSYGFYLTYSVSVDHLSAMLSELHLQRTTAS